MLFIYLLILFLQGGTVKITDRTKLDPHDPRDLPEKLVPKVKKSRGMYLNTKNSRKRKRKQNKHAAFKTRPAFS